MSLPVDAIAQYEVIVANLEKEMIELRALRRVVCLQMALRARSRTKGSARPPADGFFLSFRPGITRRRELLRSALKRAREGLGAAP